MANETPAGWDNADLDSELIKRVQEKLFDTPEDVSGIYNIETQEAVEEYQRLNQLRVDGLLGPLTLEAMGIDAGAIPRDISIDYDINIESDSEQDYIGAECDMSEPDLPGDTTTDPR